MLYLSFKFVRKFKFCVSPLVKRYPGHLRFGRFIFLTRTITSTNLQISLRGVCVRVKLQGKEKVKNVSIHNSTNHFYKTYLSMHG